MRIYRYTASLLPSVISCSIVTFDINLPHNIQGDYMRFQHKQDDKLTQTAFILRQLRNSTSVIQITLYAKVKNRFCELHADYENMECIFFDVSI